MMGLWEHAAEPPPMSVEVADAVSAIDHRKAELDRRVDLIEATLASLREGDDGDVEGHT